MQTNVCDVVKLHWSPPRDNGHTPILHYEVSMDQGQTWSQIEGGAEAREYRVTDRQSGEVVSFMVRAVNRVRETVTREAT